MGLKTTFVIQPYEIKRKQLSPGRGETSSTETGAIRRAEAMATRITGAAALKIIADDETGDLEEATVLASFGQVPEDLADQIRGVA